VSDGVELSTAFARDAESRQRHRVEQVLLGQVEVCGDEVHLAGLRLVLLQLVLQRTPRVAAAVVHAFDLVFLHAGQLPGIGLGALAMVIRGLTWPTLEEDKCSLSTFQNWAVNLERDWTLAYFQIRKAVRRGQG